MEEKMQKDRAIPVLYLIVPCYNEEEGIKGAAHIMRDKMEDLIAGKKVLEGSKILFVNDGSRDSTLSILYELADMDPIFGVLSFCSNYGHQSAILAGMLTAREYADVVITIDADLQQDIEAIDSFLASYMRGSEIVYGVRNDRSADKFMKKMTATIYYRLMRFLGANVIANSADYRLMSKKAVDALAEYGESNLFLRGLIPLIGLESDIVHFDVKKREAGRSKYTFKKMSALALDGITSFSVRPLRIIACIGLITVLLAMGLAVSTLAAYIKGNTISGYATIVLIVLVLGGGNIIKPWCDRRIHRENIY